VCSISIESNLSWGEKLTSFSLVSMKSSSEGLVLMKEIDSISLPWPTVRLFWLEDNSIAKRGPQHSVEFILLFQSLWKKEKSSLLHLKHKILDIFGWYGDNYLRNQELGLIWPDLVKIKTLNKLEISGSNDHSFKEAYEWWHLLPI
jgi:hypothetical protein